MDCLKMRGGAEGQMDGENLQEHQRSTEWTLALALKRARSKASQAQR